MSTMPSAWRRYVRPQDFVWVFLFSVLAVFTPEQTLSGGPVPARVVIILLIALGAAQVLEPRISVIASIALRLALCYLLIYFTGGVSSELYIFLLLPVITAATCYGLLGTALVTLVACAEYSSFLVYLDWAHQNIDWDGWISVALRILTLPLVGFLTHQ